MRVQSITEYNGGGILAMAGKNCVAIASDRRYGVQFQTMATDKNKLYKMHDKSVPFPAFAMAPGPDS